VSTPRRDRLAATAAPWERGRPARLAAAPRRGVAPSLASACDGQARRPPAAPCRAPVPPPGARRAGRPRSQGRSRGHPRRQGRRQATPTRTEHRAPSTAAGRRPLGARASRPLAPPTCPRYADAGLPIAAAPPEPGHAGRPVPTGPPERGRLARFSTNRGRGGHPRPAARGPRERRHRPPGSAAVAPADAPSAPGSRRSRACRERRRAVADRRHAAEPTIADAARRDAAATRLRGDGRRGDGELARSSFLAAVFLMSAPTVQDRVHESVALYTPHRARGPAAPQRDRGEVLAQRCRLHHPPLLADVG
jgi:hypothetical protein